LRVKHRSRVGHHYGLPWWSCLAFAICGDSLFSRSDLVCERKDMTKRKTPEAALRPWLLPPRIPTGFRPPARGCPALGTTLGKRPQSTTTSTRLRPINHHPGDRMLSLPAPEPREASWSAAALRRFGPTTVRASNPRCQPTPRPNRPGPLSATL